MKSRILFSDSKRIPYASLADHSSERERPEYAYSWYHLIWGDSLTNSRRHIPVCFKHMCIIRCRDIAAAAATIDDVTIFIIYCKLIGRRITRFVPAIPLRTVSGMEMSPCTLQYKTIYEAIDAYCTHLTLHYMIRRIPTRRRSAKAYRKHELQLAWIAWMTSMGAIYALAVAYMHMQQPPLVQNVPLVHYFITCLLWAKCTALGIQAACTHPTEYKLELRKLKK